MHAKALVTLPIARRRPRPSSARGDIVKLGVQTPRTRSRYRPPSTLTKPRRGDIVKLGVQTPSTRGGPATVTPNARPT